MLVSDWSSDVCSSDLAMALAATVTNTSPIRSGNRNMGGSLQRTTLLMNLRLLDGLTSGLVRRKRRGLYKIGRASCRERVEILGLVGGVRGNTVVNGVG